MDVLMDNFMDVFQVAFMVLYDLYKANQDRAEGEVLSANSNLLEQGIWS